jgi:hypothetical protein
LLCNAGAGEDVDERAIRKNGVFAMIEFKPIKEGKVREIYDNGDSLIIVSLHLM